MLLIDPRQLLPRLVKVPPWLAAGDGGWKRCCWRAEEVIDAAWLAIGERKVEEVLHACSGLVDGEGVCALG